jgi:hypothetical protein
MLLIVQVLDSRKRCSGIPAAPVASAALNTLSKLQGPGETTLMSGLFQLPQDISRSVDLIIDPSTVPMLRCF